MNIPPPVLTDSERHGLCQPVRLQLDQYRFHGNTADFIVDIDARPLARLVDDAAVGVRLYEFISIHRPGDLLNYLWITFVTVDDEIANGVRANRRHYDPAEPLRELPYVELDRFISWEGEDTRPYVYPWLRHRNGDFMRDKLNALFRLVQTFQERLRAGEDYLIQRELRLFDAGSHKFGYLANVNRVPRLIPLIDEISYIRQPAWLIDGIGELLKRDDIHSVSCPFQDFNVWRVLITEQVRRSDLTGLPPGEALFLAGPDSGLHHVPIDDWGGDVHIPCDGFPGADLLIVPDWADLRLDVVSRGAKLSSVVHGKKCQHLLLSKDYGEWPRATRQPFGEWFLYSSTEPYVRSHPDDDPTFYGMDLPPDELEFLRA